MLNGLASYAVVASKSGEKRTRVLAAMNGSPTGSPQQSPRTVGGSRGLYERHVLEGFINYDDDAVIRSLARDMYEFDPISGTVIDILSTAPFSPFELTGLPDQKMLNVYAENIDAMDLTSLSPEIAKQHMVDGAYVGTINENTDLDVLTGIVPIDITACNFTYLPFANRDPVIDVNIGDNIKKLIKSKDPRIQEEFAKYGTALQQMVSKGTFPCDPRTTIFFPNRTLATYPNGTSYLKRIIPVWLYEKALLKGTIDLAHRRQKSILHLMIGDEEYLPTEAQLGQYAKMFADADADPTGAVVATRPSIQTNEIRNGADFWRYDETNDFFTTQKMRGLGVSESLISGDLTVDGTTQVMTIFLDKLRSFREHFTRKIYYQKVLLNIAIKHGFDRKESRESVTGVDYDEKHLTKLHGKELASEIIEILQSTRVIAGDNMVVADGQKSYRLSDFHLPKIGYHKALKPEGNNELMTNLQTLQTQGLNIPLRVWAVAGGVSVPEIVRMMPEDIKLRKAFAKNKSEWPVDPNAQAQQMMASLAPHRLTAQNRELPEYEIKDKETGRVLSAKGKRMADEKANRIIAESTARLNARYNQRVKALKSVNSKYHLVKVPV